MNRKKILYLATLLLGSTLFYMCSKAPEDQSAANAIDTVGTKEVVLSDEDPLENTGYNYETLFKLETYLTDSTIVEDSIEVIDYPCAVVVYPTNAQIDAIIQEHGEDALSTIADDNSWYQGMAIQKIDSVGVGIFSADRPFLRFEGKDNLWTLDIRKKGLPEWNIIFFHPSKEPKIISAIDLTNEEVRTYFEIGKQ